ncbi:MAG: flagellar hook-associated protein FlgK [Phycisphaerae bacterium]
MSINATLNVGKSALAAQQAALQTTGNNVANASNENYSRQSVVLAPSRDAQVGAGLFIGTGIDLASIQRNVDEALNTRLRASISYTEGADSYLQWMGRVESVFNELTDEDLSSEMSLFFNSISELANKPQDVAMRRIVVQNGDRVAGRFRYLQTQLAGLRSDVDQQLKALTTRADSLARDLAKVNQDIMIEEGSSAGGTANGLRDQRDGLLSGLSQIVDVRTREGDAGMINVFIGSEPLVLGNSNRGLTLAQTQVNGKAANTVRFAKDNGPIDARGGQLAALTRTRDSIDAVTEQLDTLAGNLIFEFNKIHASGQGTDNFSSVTSTTATLDSAAVLNSAQAALAFAPTNGSFVLHVRDKVSGAESTELIQVDLDGIGADTSLDSLATAIGGVAGVSASVTGGRLTIAADSDAVDFSFSQDTSGTLAALGINTFFTGSGASDVGVNQTIKDRPQLLNAARNGERGDNQTAKMLAGLEELRVPALADQTLRSAYEVMVNGVAGKTNGARTDAEAAGVVRQTLEAQRQSLSGVSLDEEAINIMRFQRAYQGAARVISAVDEMMQTLLQLV